MSKVEVQWNVRPVDYSTEKADEIRSKMAIKYGIPKKNIYINANFIKKNADGKTEIATSDIVQNIQEPRFQQELLVHGKKDKPCPNCNNKIIKIVVNTRGTYYCKNCQK